MDIIKILASSSFFWTIIIVFVYIMLILIVRWNFIAEPKKSLLSAQLLIVLRATMKEKGSGVSMDGTREKHTVRFYKSIANRMGVVINKIFLGILRSGKKVCTMHI